MTTSAILFMVGSWAFVLGLTGWSFKRVLAQPDKANQPPTA